MFIELALPVMSVSRAPMCWVPAADEQVEMFLRCDGPTVDNGDDEIEKYLFGSYDEAILASARYYHSYLAVYPYIQELHDATTIPSEILESTVMRFA